MIPRLPHPLPDISRSDKAKSSSAPTSPSHPTPRRHGCCTFQPRLVVHLPLDLFHPIPQHHHLGPRCTHAQAQYCQVRFPSRPDGPNSRCWRWPSLEFPVLLAQPLHCQSEETDPQRPLGVSTSTSARCSGSSLCSIVAQRRSLSSGFADAWTSMVACLLSLQKLHFSPWQWGWIGLHCCSGLRAGDEVC